MRKLIVILLSAMSISAYAQYPLPDTRVYGSLEVDSSFTNEFQGYSLINDSLDLGFTKLPWVGGYRLVTPTKYFLSGFGNFSTAGEKPLTARVGMWGSSGSTMLSITDTTLAALVSDSAVYILGRQRINISGTEGDIRVSSGSDISINADSVASVAGKQELYLTANSPNQNWEFGYTAFTNDASCCNNTATMYALREDILLDVQQIYVDTLQMKMSSLYGVASSSDYNYNDLVIDSAGFSFTYGLSAGTPIWTPSGNGFIQMTQDGGLFRSDVESVTIESRNGDVNLSATKEVHLNAPAVFTPVDATTASAYTPEDGMMIYVNSTNGTFTQVGFWGYVNGTWTAMH